VGRARFGLDWDTCSVIVIFIACGFVAPVELMAAVVDKCPSVRLD
jgi:hypothetical protein